MTLTSELVGTQRQIVQTFVWTDTSGLTNTSVFIAAVLLNNYAQSIHGPGVWLDDAATLGLPNYEPIVSLAGNTYVQNRWLDVEYHRRFGVAVLDADLILPNQIYTITWRTPPGLAEVDNGDWSLVQARKFFPECNVRACVVEQIQCRVNEHEYEIDPIQHEAEFMFTKPYPGPCYNLTWSGFLYMPLIDQ